MKQNEKFTLAVFLFLIILTIIITPALVPVQGVPGNVTTFNVTLIVNSGSPTITYIYPISDSPNEGTTKTVSFYFNATHPNGVANILSTGADVRINQSGTTLTQTACVVKATDGVTTNMYECNISINYYTAPGTWTINATITDLAANFDSDLGIYTNGNTYGIVLKASTISFGGTPGTDNNPASQNPQYVNNTGNVAFNRINLTAYNLESGANIIGAGNFTANTTISGGPGHILSNNVPVTLADSAISVQGSKNIYLYADIPAGTPNGTYTTTSDWIVTVN
jgi:hypothetical protein